MHMVELLLLQTEQQAAQLLVLGLTPSTGISVSGGPITTTGNITVTNTGVTRLNAGSGIAVSGANGNVTVSSTNLAEGTVQSVGLTSATLTVHSAAYTSMAY